MNYSKPELQTLGEATMVIEAHQKVNPPNIDGLRPQPNPAYDLDE
jgi:hypothetical protein